MPPADQVGGDGIHAADVMTVNVMTVTPDTSVHDQAGLLKGVPLVDANRLVGVVTEHDQLRCAEIGTGRRTERWPARWLDVVSLRDTPAADSIRAHGLTVGDLMMGDLITDSEGTDLGQVADLLETTRIKRVPVVHKGTLVSIISRADLVRPWR